MQANENVFSVKSPGQNGAVSTIAEKRWQSIISLLRVKARSLSELCTELHASASVIREDLRNLVKTCIIYRKPVMGSHDKPGRPPIPYDVATRRIRILCPGCNKAGTIEVNKCLMGAMLADEGTGLIEMHVFAGEICVHDLVIFMDGNYMVRTVSISER